MGNLRAVEAVIDLNHADAERLFGLGASQHRRHLKHPSWDACTALDDVFLLVDSGRFELRFAFVCTQDMIVDDHIFVVVLFVFHNVTTFERNVKVRAVVVKLHKLEANAARSTQAPVDDVWAELGRYADAARSAA